MDFLRNRALKLFTGANNILMENRTPSYKDLENKFDDIDELGLYLHIPFCKQICPYCPYNKELYEFEKAKLYLKAVKSEVDYYKNLFGDKQVTSFYIGGGTPTTILYDGLYETLDYIYSNFNMQCGIHMESHPNDLSLKNLNTIKSFGIKYLSTGIEALEDKYLNFLKRPYNSNRVKEVIKNALSMDFDCFNVDFIFDLPGQTYKELEKYGDELVKLGVDQVASYPLFIFPYTEMLKIIGKSNFDISRIFRRRKMLSILENIFYSAKYKRTSVWAFTKKGFPKYCSVTVPLYVGLGAGGGTCLKDVFYINTFNVSEYINNLINRKTAIALSLSMTGKIEMAWWFYWRIYETQFKRSDFKIRFKQNFDKIYGKYIKLFSLFGLIKKDDGNEVILSDKGIFWLHAFEDIFSINYIGKLWGESLINPWPKIVVL